MQRKIASFKHILFPGTGCGVPNTLMVFCSVNSCRVKNKLKIFTND